MNPEERFAELWNDWLEGDLDAAGQAELRALLDEHESLRTRAADLFQTHRLLGFTATENEAGAESFVQATLARLPRSEGAFVEGVMDQVKLIPFDAQAPASAPAKWHRREWLAAAATILFSAAGAAWWWRKNEAVVPFARVLQNAGALVLRHGVSVAIGGALPQGRLALVQGSLGLIYGRGVQLVIEAPAEFECRHADLLLLHSGRVAANVPPEAVGFTVETPRGQVVDRGTRFALDAAARGEVHVFEGKVDAQSRSGSNSARRLVTGEAASFAQGLTALELRDGAFVQPEEMPAVVAGLRAGQFQRWLAWRQQAQSDESLILFSDLDPARLDQSAAHLSVAGTRTVQGRWPGKQCLDFNQQGDAVKLDAGADREWPQLTLSTWVRLDRLGEPYQSLYHTDGWQREQLGQVHWMIIKSTTMRLALRGNVVQGATKENIFADSLLPVLPERGRWVHLAAVYDSGAQTVRFFLNGAFDNEVKHALAHPALLGPAQIGNWNEHDRKLSGRVDELVILGRALSDDEVHAIHAAGNPYA